MVRHLFSILTTQLLRYITFCILGVILLFGLHQLAFATSELNYRVYSEPKSAVHVVTIPAESNYIITTEITANLTPIADFATRNNAVAAINGGYFDPQNSKTTSYITQQGNLVADPRINERLIDNRDLEPYLGKILNRTEFRRYQCEDTRYDITSHTAEIPDGCILQDALGAGPQLLPVDTSVAEGFTAYEDDKLIRDAIGREALNARSAIAITKEGDVILAMVQQQDSTDSGMSLPDLAAFLRSLGATKAMNLDGGSSSSLYYQGDTYYGKLDSEGNEVQRPLKSVLLITNY